MARIASTRRSLAPGGFFFLLLLLAVGIASIPAQGQRTRFGRDEVPLGDLIEIGPEDVC